MKTSELHTLKSILTEGIRIEGQDEPVKISCIYIPKIQRAYAQGRNKESDIRNDFLETLFSVLTSEEEKSIELSFLFGSRPVVAKIPSDGFELLDGQQRTTTLFLLYWYVSMKEKGCVQEFLSKFTYETRDTSKQFLSHITAGDFKISINENMPSTAIKNNKWFTDDYYCDPTVCAMLTMLDSIDEMYRKYNCSNIFDKLERLKFYVLMLEEFDMNDELYIKMNSRGLSLVPFENFKASIVRYMKSEERNGLYGAEEVENGEPPFWFTFISNMDAKWIDIFWRYNQSDEEKERECKNIIEIDDRLIGTRYFNFINRYLFTKAVLANAKDSLISFFYNETESEKMKNRFFGENYYEQIFRQYEEINKEDTLFHKLQRVFEAFRGDSGKYIERSIQGDPFGRTNRFEIVADKFNNLHERVVFAAVTEFIENMPEGATLAQENIRTNFERMLRVAFNIIENTLIENLEGVVGVIRAFSELNFAYGAISDNFYKSLATTKFKSDNDQLKEEILKAKEMFSADGTFNPDWERVFKYAEYHPFFKGSILFFFTEKSGDSEAFMGRYNVVKDLFDENGITSEYREDHILFRALLSQFNSWNTLLGKHGRYITEDAETQKYLKNGIIRQPEIREMFRRYFGSDDNKKPIKEYLRDVVVNAAPQKDESSGFKLLFNRLITDLTSVPLLDWVGTSGKIFRIQANRSSLVINSPGAWYDRIILDTERHLIIPSLVSKYSMDYEDSNQREWFEGPIRDSWGWDISIRKEVVGKLGTFVLKLTFQEWKWVDFYILGQDTDWLAKEFNVPVERKHEDFVQVTSVEYRLREDIQPIEEEIDRIISKLQEL